MTASVRLRCLQAIEAVLTSMQDGDKAYFSQVKWGGLLDDDSRRLRSAGIIAGNEVKTTMFPLQECRLEIDIELMMLWNSTQTEPSGVVAERLVTDVQKALAADYSLGGLAINFIETGNRVQLENWKDQTIKAVVFYELQYRHNQSDPTSPV